MIAVTPPIIFPKEVAQNRPPHFLARTSFGTRNRFTPHFQGWGLDENLKPKVPPTPEAERIRTSIEAGAVVSCRTPALTRLRPASITDAFHAAF
jgi:hypothetical protein